MCETSLDIDGGWEGPAIFFRYVLARAMSSVDNEQPI